MPITIAHSFLKTIAKGILVAILESGPIIFQNEIFIII